MYVWKSTVCEMINYCLQYCHDPEYMQQTLEYVEYWNTEHKDRDVADLIGLLKTIIADQSANSAE